MAAGLSKGVAIDPRQQPESVLEPSEQHLSSERGDHSVEQHHDREEPTLPGKDALAVAATMKKSSKRSGLEGCPIAVRTAQDQNRPVAEDVSTLIEQERGALADFLETLTRDEWLSASLCSEWTVQEVAAHVSFAPTVRLRTILVALARDGFRANRTSARLSREWAAQRGPEAIVAGLRDPNSINNPTPGTRLADVLADTITHHLDVRVPLDRERAAPVEATGIALTAYTRQGFPLSLAFGRNPKATAKGLRLVAEDIGWSHGDGPVVTASSSALVRALTGRSVRRSELSGAGADLLFGRLDR